MNNHLPNGWIKAIKTLISTTPILPLPRTKTASTMAPYKQHKTPTKAPNISKKKIQINPKTSIQSLTKPRKELIKIKTRTCLIIS